MTKKEIKEKAKEICLNMIVNAQTGLENHKGAHGYTVQVAIEDLDLCNAVKILLQKGKQFSFSTVEVNPDATVSKWQVRAILERNKQPTMKPGKKPVVKKLGMTRACRRVRAELSFIRWRMEEYGGRVEDLSESLLKSVNREAEMKKLLANTQNIHLIELHTLRERMYLRSCLLLFWILGATAAAALVIYYPLFHR